MTTIAAAGDGPQLSRNDRPEGAADVDHRIEDSEAERLVRLVGDRSNGAGYQRLEDPGRQPDTQHRKSDPREGPGGNQQEDRGQIGQVRDDQNFLEPESVGKGAGDDGSHIGKGQKQALNDAQFTPAVPEVLHVDSEAEVDAVVGKALQDLDRIGHPEDRRKCGSLAG